MGRACHLNGKMPLRLASALRFKFPAYNAALTDDGLEGTQSNFVVIGDRDGHSSSSGSALHHDMTATTPYFCKPMLR